MDSWYCSGDPGSTRWLWPTKYSVNPSGMQMTLSGAHAAVAQEPRFVGGEWWFRTKPTDRRPCYLGESPLPSPLCKRGETAATAATLWPRVHRVLTWPRRPPRRSSIFNRHLRLWSESWAESSPGVRRPRDRRVASATVLRRTVIGGNLWSAGRGRPPNVSAARGPCQFPAR